VNEGDPTRQDEPADPGLSAAADPGPSAAAAVLGDLDASSEGRQQEKPSRGRGVLIAVVVVGLVFLLGAVIFRGPGTSHLDPNDPSGETAPSFGLDTIRGSHVNFPADFKGKPVFVNFWASWCGPCNDEAPVLADAYRRWQGSGIRFLGVDESDSVEWARQFEDWYGITYDSAFDPTGKQYRAWGLTGYPETFLVNADGKILEKKIGAFYDPQTIDQYLALLAPNFTPKPPGKIVAPTATPPVPTSPPP
jgi:cytochrome c biogenesis protein CcmG/thiol:disulfide interchange protein DsbE